MDNNKKLLSTLMLFIIVAFFGSEAAVHAGSREAKPAKGDILIIEGKIAYVGSARHAFLAITTKDGKQYKISGKLEQELADNYQELIVRVEAEIIKELPPPRQTEINVLEILKVIK